MGGSSGKVLKRDLVHYYYMKVEIYKYAFRGGVGWLVLCRINDAFLRVTGYADLEWTLSPDVG
jgi:hypothetical protein